jgi:hypothetical protein
MSPLLYFPPPRCTYSIIINPYHAQIATIASHGHVEDVPSGNVKVVFTLASRECSEEIQRDVIIISRGNYFFPAGA